MIGVRKLLDYVFTKAELRILDDILPEFNRKQKIALEEELDKQVGYYNFGFPKDNDLNLYFFNRRIWMTKMSRITARTF